MKTTLNKKKSVINDENESLATLYRVTLELKDCRNIDMGTMFEE